MTHEEMCGTNTLMVVVTIPMELEVEGVVRWCENCGAIVVDCDFDGRTNAGQFMKMRFPKLLRNQAQR